MYDCQRQSVNNSLFSLCLYFDFTINYGQHSPMFVFVIVFEGESTEGGARWRRRSKWVKRINLPPLFPPPLGSAIQASKHNYSELERLLSIKRYYKALYWWWMLCFFDIILLPLIAFRDKYKGNRKITLPPPSPITPPSLKMSLIPVVADHLEGKKGRHLLINCL